MIASEQPFRGVEMNMGSYSFDNALLMRLDGRRGCGVRGVIVLQLAAALRTPRRCLFMAE